jgi:hypothetical protein
MRAEEQDVNDDRGDPARPRPPNGGRHPGAPRPTACHPPHLADGHPAVARRHVRVLRPVHDWLRHPRYGEIRAFDQRVDRHVLGSSPVRRFDLLRLVHWHLRLRLCRRQIRAAGNFHLLHAGVLRCHADHGVPDDRLWRLSLAYDRRHRDRRGIGHHRHVCRRTGAKTHARPGVRVQSVRAVFGRADCRVTFLRAGAARAAGMGRMALGGRDLAPSVLCSFGFSAAPSRKAHAGC